MDPLTHALSGALLVRAVEPALPEMRILPPRILLISGFTAAAFPDIDVVLRLVDTLTYLNWHQGPTHSLVMLPLWALLLAHLFSRVTRRRYSWRLFFIPACLGLAIHIVGDLITSYGLMLLAPFSSARFSMSLAFVIDLWFSALIVFGLVISLILPGKRYIAGLALVCLAFYVVFLGVLHEKAERVGESYAKEIMGSHTKISAIPQPFSPYHWKIIVTEGETYHILWVNLGSDVSGTYRDLGVLSRMFAAYQPLASAQWQQYKQFGDFPVDTSLVREAWHHPAMTEFRRFAVFPQLDRIEYHEKGVCAWFYDLRFKFPLLPPSFRYGGCRKAGSDDWHLQRQRGTFWID